MAELDFSITNHITDLDLIDQVSKFRSGVGHDFSWLRDFDDDTLAIVASIPNFFANDTSEPPSSMKHYFMPLADYRGDQGDGSSIPVYAPFDGTITRVTQEDRDGEGPSAAKIEITSAVDDRYTAMLFHVNLDALYPSVYNDYPTLGEVYTHTEDDSDYSTLSISAGDLLGFAELTSANDFDVAILFSDTAASTWMSVFDLMPEDLLQDYDAKGIDSTQLVISKEERLADPLGEDAWGTYSAGDWSVLSQTVANNVDAMIMTDSTHYLNNTVINYYKDDADTGVSTAVEAGAIKISQSVTFDAVKLSESTAYTFDIKIGDAIDILRHIVDIKTLDPTSNQFHAADVDNDGAVNIGDAIDVLRHIVDIKKIDTFDLIDAQGARVTQLDPGATGGAPNWTVVANGDVDLSGSFTDVYSLSVDSIVTNSAPTAISLSATSIAENAVAAHVANISGTDPESDLLTYSISGGADAAKFEIVGNMLHLATGIAADYETDNQLEVEVQATDPSGLSYQELFTINVTDVAESISGSIVDGYVAGATIFQDLNNDNILDDGEPYTITNSVGRFTLANVISSVDAPLKMIYGLDIGTNQKIVTTMIAPSHVQQNIVVSPLSTVAYRAFDSAEDSSFQTIMGQVATYFKVSSNSQTTLDLTRDNPLEGIRSDDSTVATASRDALQANQLVMSLAHASESLAKYVATTIDSQVKTALNTAGTSSYSGIFDFSAYQKIGADALIKTAAARAISSALGTTSSTAGELNALASGTVSVLKEAVASALVAHYSSSRVIWNGSATAINEVISPNFVTDAVNALSPNTSSGMSSILHAFFTSADAAISSVEAGADAAGYGATLMAANAAAKSFNPGALLGTTINKDGSYLQGESTETLTAAVDAQYTISKDSSNEMIGDVFGDDTSTNFPDAVVVMLTEGDDTETLTDASEIIATFDGNDTVSGAGGDDKITGGKDVDILSGDAGDDQLYGYSGNDVLTGGAGDDKIVGGLGDDIIDGGAGDDYLLGQTGNDTITTGGGSNEVYGGLGDDTIIVTGKYSTDSGSLASAVEEFMDYGSTDGLTDWLKDQSGNALDDLASLLDSSSTNPIILGYSGQKVGDTLTEVTTDLGDIFSILAEGVSQTWDLFAGNYNMPTEYDSIETAVDKSSFVVNFPAGGTNPDGSSFQGARLTFLGSNLDPNDAYNANYTISQVKLDVLETAGDYTNISHSFTLDSDVVISDQVLQASKLQGFKLTYGNDFIAELTGDVNLTSFSATELVAPVAHLQMRVGDNIVNDPTAKVTASLFLDGSITYNLATDSLSGDIDGLGADISGRKLTVNDLNLTIADIENFSATTWLNELLASNPVIDITSNGDASYSMASGTASVEASINGVLAYDDLTKEVSWTNAGLSIDYNNTDPDASLTSATITATASDVLTYNFDTQQASGLIAGSYSSTGDASYTRTGDVSIDLASNDIINITDKTGAFTDTINGGAGTDTLNINYSGITGLSDFVVSKSGDVTTLTDASGGTINYEGIENLTINSHQIFFSENGLSNALWSPDELQITALHGSIWSTNRITHTGSSGGGNGLSGISTGIVGETISEDITYIAAEGQQTIILTGDRENSYTGNLDISMGDIQDSINMAHFKSGDSVDMGAGDDYVKFGYADADWSDGFGSLGMADFDNFSMLKLDGGDGLDTLDFSGSGTSTGGKDLTLTFGNATNFENITGTSMAESLIGDANANTIKGNGGADTLYGNAGNDILYGYAEDFMDDGASSQSGDDILYGGAGDDMLYGTAGENTLDGGTGKDTMYGGNGADTFVLRAGDGSSTLASADVIADFQNGTDVIGMDGLSFDDLTISQGTGSNASHTIIQYTDTSEYLAIIQNTTVGNITALDFTSTSTDAQTLTGTSGNNTLIGGAGVDTVNGGAGSDTVYSWGGDDIINITDKTGAFTDTINGGAGTDTLNINYSGITGLSDFVVSKSGDVTTLTDASGGTINYEGIENLTINSHQIFFSENGLSNALWSPDELQITALHGSIWSTNRITHTGSSGGGNGLSGISTGIVGETISEDITYIAAEGQQTIILTGDRENSYTGNLDISMGDIQDSINMAHFKSGDSVDMGAGDDYVKFGYADADWSDGFGSLGMADFDNFSMLKLDGGDGLDTLDFSGSGTSTGGKDLTLTFGNATNFENITGTSMAESLIGDANANTIKGNGGADTLYGNAGNDILYGYAEDFMDDGASSQSGDDILYGGAGDDMLYGTAGENTLDGGTGKDTMAGGNGADTFIIRSGDGSSTLANADVITDFLDRTDLIGMDDGLLFDELTIEQGTGDYANDTIISITDEYLAIIEGVSAIELTEVDFTPVDIV